MLYPKEHKEVIDIKKVKFKDIDYKQEFFDSLRNEYEEFDSWFVKKADDDAYVIENHNTIEAMTAYKIEQENDSLTLKIRICKSDKSIYFLEWVIWMAIHQALEQNISTIYFTHFIKIEDRLRDIAYTFGFKSDKTNSRGEHIFTKELSYNINMNAKANFPYIKINPQTKFFLIPIQKYFSSALFPTQKSSDLFNIIHSSKEGNAIEKIYVCASNIKKIEIGSIILFYESQSNKNIVAMGSIMKIQRIKNTNDFKKYENRSVFSERHIDEMLSGLKPEQELLIISFMLSSYLNKPIPNTITIPQSIMELTKEDFNTILNGDIAWKLLYQLDQNI